MAREHVTKGIGKVSSTSTGVNAPSVVTAPTVSGGEMKLVSQTTKGWNEEKLARSAWSAQSARVEFQHAARMIGAPAIVSEVRDFLLRATADLSDVRISFSGQNTLYSWGGLLSFVNSDPCRHYFGSTQASATIVETGSDPVLLPPYSVGGVPGVWGNVVLKLLDIAYSRRFGGSFCAVLAPSEDCGIELSDSAKNIAVDLHNWVLRLYVQPSRPVFNNPYSPQLASLLALMHCEIDVTQSEAYQLNGLLPLAPTVTQADIDALIQQGEQQAVPRLANLARFLFGWVHYLNIPAFNRTVERVDRIHVSSGICHFDLSNKTPTIWVELKIGYLFLSEGMFDSERELTAEPLIELRTPPLMVLRTAKERYIGNAQDTGWMHMGYISPSDFKTVHEVNVFPMWTEHDPFSDDEGGHMGWTMNLAPDSAAIDQCITGQQPGPVGESLFILTNDPLKDWTSYSIEVRFGLTWI